MTPITRRAIILQTASGHQRPMEIFSLNKVDHRNPRKLPAADQLQRNGPLGEVACTGLRAGAPAAL
jgi:hypothetical protein